MPTSSSSSKKKTTTTTSTTSQFGTSAAKPKNTEQESVQPTSVVYVPITVPSTSSGSSKSSPAQSSGTESSAPAQTSKPTVSVPTAQSSGTESSAPAQTSKPTVSVPTVQNVQAPKVMGQETTNVQAEIAKGVKEGRVAPAYFAPASLPGYLQDIYTRQNYYGSTVGPQVYRGQENKINRMDEVSATPSLYTVPRAPFQYSEQQQADMVDEWNNYYKWAIDENGNYLYRNYAEYALDRFGITATGAGEQQGQGPRIPGSTRNSDTTIIPPPVYYDPYGSYGEQQEEGGYGEYVNFEEPTGQAEANWTEQYHIPGAPDWWRGFVPDITNPELEYASLLNSLLPFLSGEDQKSIAMNLAMLYPKVFGNYSAVFGQYQNGSMYDSRRANTATNGIPYLGSPYGEQYQRTFYSQERANEMLGALDVVRGKMQKSDSDMGPGYTYLKQLASTIRDFGGVNNRLPTRQQFTQLLGSLDTLLATTESDSLSAYGPVSKMIATPFLSGGQVMPVTKQSDGSYIFGTAAKTLF